MAETETKEKWYSSMMTNDGVILLKILDEKYTDKIVKILNIHMDDNKEVVFDVKDFPEELSDDQYFISQIQKAIGDIVTQAMVQLHADQAKAEHTIQDIYFTNILKKYHIHSKTTLTTTQIMKAIKLYPAPLIENEDLLPEDGANIDEYVKNAQGFSDYSVFDMETNKEYKMTVEKDVEDFLAILKERGKEYVF